MGLSKWVIGYSLFNICVIILLVGVGDLFSSQYSDANFTHNTSIDTGSTIDRDDISLWDSFTWSIQGLPWWIDMLLLIDAIIGAWLFIAFIRGGGNA